MPNTHCLPTGSLGTNQIPMVQFPGNPGTIFTPAGSKRGVVVISYGITGFGQYPYPCANVTGAGPVNWLTLAQDLQADGWVVIWPTQIGVDAPPGQTAALINDIGDASGGSGSRVGTTYLWWAEHAINYCQLNYPSFPIVPLGVSQGGLPTVQWVTNHVSSIAAYCLHIPVLRPWVLAGGPSPNTTWSLASGMNGLTLPQSTITVTTSTSGAPSSGVLTVGASPSTQQGIVYTGTGTNTFTGCTGGDGTSTLSTGGQVKQSTWSSGLDVSLTAFNSLGNGSQGTKPVGYIGWETGDESLGYATMQTLANNASGAGQPVTGQARTGGAHQMDSTDITNITNWFTATVDPLCPAVH